MLAWRYDTLVPLLMTLARHDDDDDKEEGVVFVRKTGAVWHGIRIRYRMDRGFGDLSSRSDYKATGN